MELSSPTDHQAIRCSKTEAYRSPTEAYRSTSLVNTYKQWLHKLENKNLLMYTDTCHGRLVEKCVKHNLALPGALNWSDAYFLDQMFFKTGGVYKLDDWGRPPTGEEITISPIRVYNPKEPHNSHGSPEEVIVLKCITGIVKNRGMLTFDLESIE